MNNEIIKTLQIKKETVICDVKTTMDGKKEYNRIKFIDENNNNYAFNANYPLFNKLFEQLDSGTLPIISEVYNSTKYGNWYEVKIPFELNPYETTKKYLFKSDKLS